ncbi:hypothetical protein SAMN06265371_10111 [Lutibacter agarilyticus]|uniref:HprK-related kinase B n=1 Tax=Lutibacter agarilyticus TaxID=1109740 RepID=A0A238V6V9_9FLAO|nr:hypothetical protein [Lutibacter agarilyticus]SNR30155.1 hypothetical protein SAMN06265371_10111 [Lutibacter agarilyticus]
MKNNLAPTYSQIIDQHFIHWFQKSNSYIIINEVLNNYLTNYFTAKNKSDFIFKVASTEKLKNENLEAEAIYNDISLFLEEQNKPLSLNEAKENEFDNSYRNYKESYQINKHTVEIYFSSEKIKQYIHPQLMHLCGISKNKKTTIFDIYEQHNNLHLFKNEKFIGSYEPTNYHLLQGRFVMELLCVLHNTKEHDWLGTFHASTVSNGKEAIMLVGDSGNGKSTFCSLLMASGLDLMADDITPILSKNKEVYHYPAAISIKQGAFEMLTNYIPHFNKFDSFDSGTKKGLLKYIPPQQHFENTIQHLPCTKIVYVKYDSLASTSLIKTGADKVLQTLIPDSWVSPQHKNAKQFLNWLENLSYYELNYSDNNKAIEFFKQLFSN